MGNVHGHRFLEEEVDWVAYATEDWRSARVRELDQMGGLARPALPLGESFNRKLEYLGANVLEQASEIRDLFSNKKDRAAAQGTENTVQVEKRRIKRKGVQGVLEVAEWRFRVHAARKRIFLVILVCVRLRVGLKKPTRLRRMDTFSYMIPLIFGEDSAKFIEAQLVAIASKDKAANEAEAAQQRSARALLAGTEPPAAAAAAAAAAGDQDRSAAKPPGPLQQFPADLQPRTSPATEPPSSPRHSAGSAASAPKLLTAAEHLTDASYGLLSQGPMGLSSPLSKRSSYPGPLSPGPGHPRHEFKNPARLEYPAQSLPSNAGPMSPKAKLLLSPVQALHSPGPKARQHPGKPEHSILDDFSSASASPDSLSPTDSSSSKGCPDAAPPPPAGPCTDFVSGASSPCGRISEDGAPQGYAAAASISLLDLDQKSGGAGGASALPAIKQQRGTMLPLPGHRQRHVSESGFLLQAPGGQPSQAQARLMMRVSDHSRLLPRGSAQSEAGAAPPGVEASRSAVPVLPQVPVSRSSPSLGEGEAGQGRGDPEARAAARSARYAAMKERERSARKPAGPQWNSLFKKAPPPSDREARKSAPNLSLPAISARPSPKSARPSASSSIGRMLLRPSPPAPRFLPVSVPSLSRHALRDQAAEELLEQARQLDPAWSIGEEARRHLLTRSFSAIEQEDGQRSEMMLSMYTNRRNTAWSSQQRWSAPSVTTAPDLHHAAAQASTSSPEYAQAAAHVRRGRVAFWFLVGDDSLPTAPQKASTSGPSSPSQDIWTSDPYDVISSCRPGLLHDMRDRVTRGHSFQSRALGSLALSIQDIGGRDALSKAIVILSINDEQEEEVTKSLWDNKFYGFGRENVIVIAQSRRLGYRYDLGAQRFIGVQQSAPESTGSGFAAMQLNWCPDAFVLSAEGLVQGIFGTPAEMLAQRGVQWMLCHRARDLVVMEGCLNSSFLALGEKLLSAQGVNMLTQVVLSDNMGTARSLDSIVLARNGAGNSELRMAELSSHLLDKAVQKAKAENSGHVAVGIQRYLFHVPSLKKNLVSNLDFRPKLRVRDGLLFLRYEISDLTSMPGAVLGAVQVPKPELLSSPKDMDALLAAAQQQDSDRRLMSLLEDLRPKVPVTPQQLLAAQQPRTPSERSGLGASATTVVFVDQALASLPAVRLAVSLARPARDAVNLCTFVTDAAHVESGKAMLMNVVERLGSASVTVRIDVVVRDASSLLDCMCRYLKTWQADLVVVTTRGLTKTEPSAILGSVCLAIIKRMEVPVLIVTPKSAQASNLMYDRRMVRMLLMVEGWTQPLLEYSVERLIVPRRGDNLLLGQVCSSRICTKQQAFNMRRYLAESQRFVDSRSVGRSEAISLDGLFEQVVEKTVQDYRVNLVGVQLPPGSKALPKSLISLICSCSSAILVFKKQAPEGPEEPDGSDSGAEDKD